MQHLAMLQHRISTPQPTPRVLQNILLVLFWLLPPMDSLTGWLWWNGVRESVVFKYPIVLMGLMLATAFFFGALGKRDWLLFGALAAIGGVNLAVNWLWMPDFTFNTYCITGLAGIAFVQSVYRMLKTGILPGTFFHRALSGLCFVAPLTIILPQLIGAGYPAYFYGEGNPANFGHMGFYASSNEINAVLIVGLGYSFFRLYKEYSWQMLFAAALLTYSNCQIQSRSSMVLCALEWTVFLVMLVLSKGRRKQFLVCAAVCAALLVLLAPTIDNFVKKQAQSLENTPIDMENRLENNLTNGRFERIWEMPKLKQPGEPGADEFQSMQLYPWVGSFCSNFEVLGIAEMDFVDSFKCLGVFGGAMFCLYYAWAGLRTYCAQRRIISCFGLLCVFAFSFLTGHILFTWSQVMWFGIYMAALMTGPSPQAPFYWRWIPQSLRRKLDAADFAMC